MPRRGRIKDSGACGSINFSHHSSISFEIESDQVEHVIHEKYEENVMPFNENNGKPATSHSKEYNLSSTIVQQPEVNPNLIIGKSNDHFTVDESAGFSFQIAETVRKHDMFGERLSGELGFKSDINFRDFLEFENKYL